MHDKKLIQYKTHQDKVELLRSPWDCWKQLRQAQGLPCCPKTGRHILLSLHDARSLACLCLRVYGWSLGLLGLRTAISTKTLPLIVFRALCLQKEFTTLFVLHEGRQHLCIRLIQFFDTCYQNLWMLQCFLCAFDQGRQDLAWQMSAYSPSLQDIHRICPCPTSQHQPSRSGNHIREAWRSCDVMRNQHCHVWSNLAWPILDWFLTYPVGPCSLHRHIVVVYLCGVRVRRL